MCSPVREEVVKVVEATLELENRAKVHQAVRSNNGCSLSTGDPGSPDYPIPQELISAHYNSLASSLYLGIVGSVNVLAGKNSCGTMKEENTIIILLQFSNLEHSDMLLRISRNYLRE